MIMVRKSEQNEQNDQPTDEAKEADQEVQSDPEGVAEAGNAEVQAKVDDETEKGFRGTVPDPTPNENYTVEGVTAGKPTPETDADLAAEARASVRGNDIPITKDGDK